MGINFGSLENPTAVSSASAAANGISLDLNKGDILDITKRSPGLTKVRLGAGWDAAVAGETFDLDISAFLLNSNGKITSGSDVVFFNNKTAPGVTLNGDNRTGVGEGDDETIDIDLSAVSPNVEKIVFVVVIDKAQAKRQTFGMINNAYVRLINTAAGDTELCRFILKDDYSTDTGVIFAELARNGAEWEFKAVGEGKQGDLNTFAGMYQ